MCFFGFLDSGVNSIIYDMIMIFNTICKDRCTLIIETLVLKNENIFLIFRNDCSCELQL